MVDGITVKPVTLTKRTICISDIHGWVTLLDRLLAQIHYTPGRDTLLILGDIIAKGPDGHGTLNRVMELSRFPNVHVLRGNCDTPNRLKHPTAEQVAFLESLPDALEGGDYLFIHGNRKTPETNRWVIRGHMPTLNFRENVPCFNPIIDEARRTVDIDGGCGVKAQTGGQLIAFIIENGVFSFEAADDYPPYTVNQTQEEGGGTLLIRWDNRFIEVLERGEEISAVRHLETGRVLAHPTAHLYTWQGEIYSGFWTDYRLPVRAGETVKLVLALSDRVLAKKNGVLGWLCPDIPSRDAASGGSYIQA